MNDIVEYEPLTQERLVSLETRAQYMATQEDIVRPEGKFDASVEMLKGFIQEAVSQSEIKTLKRFIGFWVTVVSLLSGAISLAVNKLFA